VTFISFLKEQNYSSYLEKFYQFLLKHLPNAEREMLQTVRMQCKKEQVYLFQHDEAEDAVLEDRLEETLELSISREFKVLQSVGDLRVFFQDDR
jgi:hypothetical protein